MAENIAALKKKAKKMYLEYQHAFDQVDCGVALFEQLRPDMALQMREVESIVKRCKELEAKKC